MLLTHIIYRYKKERNVLFNDTLNTFYLRLYGVRHMVKDHSDSKRGNPLPQHGLSFRLAARVLLYAPSHRQDSTYHSLWYTSRGALAGRYWACILVQAATKSIILKYHYTHLFLQQLSIN